MSPTVRGQLNEFGKLTAAYAAFAVVFVAVQPDPADPWPPFAAGMLGWLVGWLLASVVLERRRPWRKSEPRPRTERRWGATIAVMAVLVPVTCVSFVLLYAPEIPPVSRSTWLYDRLLFLLPMWAWYGAPILVPRGRALSPDEPKRRPVEFESLIPRFRWPR